MTVDLQGQLRSLLQLPYERVVEQSCAVYDTACIDILVKTGILDSMMARQARRMSALEMQHSFDIDAGKLTPMLRYLASQGWLHEPEEGVFALTRMSLELRPGRNGRKWIMCV